MLERDFVISGVSVCLSVCLSVTRWYSAKTNKSRIMRFVCARYVRLNVVCGFQRERKREEEGERQRDIVNAIEVVFPSVCLL